LPGLFALALAKLQIAQDIAIIGSLAAISSVTRASSRVEFTEPEFTGTGAQPPYFG
jgi:hypothetical protein